MASVSREKSGGSVATTLSNLVLEGDKKKQYQDADPDEHGVAIPVVAAANHAGTLGGAFAAAVRLIGLRR
jgi:hypothetical protein